MKTRHLSVMLALLLAVGVGLSAAVLVLGPRRVEREAVELFRSQQSLIAEQGATQIARTFRDIQTRLDEAVERVEGSGEFYRRPEVARRILEQLAHDSDPDIGLALMITSDEGGIVAVGPGVEEERARELDSLQWSLQERELTEPVYVCAHCLEHEGSVSIISAMGGGYNLVANVELDTLLSDIFEQITRGRQAHAALLAKGDQILFEEDTGAILDSDEVIVGTAVIPYTDWSVLVETPYSVIAPGVRGSVRSVLYASSGLLIVLALALGLLGYLAVRAETERIARGKALAQTDKLVTVGMLGSSIAHEIRNVIAVVQMNIELARRRGQGDQEHLDRASAGVDRLTKLAQNITNYVGAQKDEAHVFGLREAVREAIELVEPKVGEGALTLRATANPSVSGSKVAVSQVVVNLILNAYDEMSKMSDPEILVGVREEDGFAVVDVTDNGPGISPAIFDDIFEPFISTKNHQSGAQGGTGLGLWLCSEIVSQHDGTIRAENHGNGARFSVRLPVAYGGGSIQQTSRAPEPPERDAETLRS